MIYEKILIMGHTKEGKKFRPSDWAERLYYTVAEYGSCLLYTSDAADE